VGLLSAILWALLCWAPAQAAEDDARTTTIKAAFLVNVLRSVDFPAEPAELDGAALVYIADPAETDLSTLLPDLASQAVLTVGEGGAFQTAGGMNSVHVSRGRLGFCIVPERSKGAGLQMNSRLLSVSDCAIGPG
jgi:hypothetical protein